MLKARDLSFDYGGARPALAGFSHAFASRGTTVVLGASGSGKSTLLKLIAGQLPLGPGRLFHRGVDLAGVPPQGRGFGLVPQDGGLFGHLDALDNVAFGLRVRGLGRRERRTRALEWLDLVGLAPLAGRYPHQLSGGEGKRLALARALAVEPSHLLLDEPFSALDAGMRRGLRQELRRLLASRRVAALLVTHDQEEAFEMAHTLLVLDGGRLLQAGPPAELFWRPKDRFVAAFLGPVAFLEGQCGIRAGKPRLSCRWFTSAAPPGMRPGPGTVMVRPEALLPARGARAHLRMRLLEVRGAGPAWSHLLERGGQRLEFRAGAPLGRRGALIPFTVDARRLWFFPAQG